MDQQYLEVDVHNEFAKRMEAEHERQNHRIEAMEESLKETRTLALAIERLTISVKSMVEVQKDQNNRLETLENRDGEMWRKVVGYVITTIVGLVIGLVWNTFAG